MTWSLAALAAIPAASESSGGEQSILLPAIYDIVWSAVSFAIIFWLFAKFVMPRMRTMLAERTEKIEGGVARAEEMQAEARAALAQYQAQLATARDEAAAIREKAEAEKVQIIAEARREAETQASSIHASAAAQIAAERAKAAAELRRDAGSTATDLAEKIIGESLDRDRARSVVDRFITELEQAGR